MSSPTPRQLADLMKDLDYTLGVLTAAADHLRAAIAVLTFEHGTDEQQPVTLQRKH